MNLLIGYIILQFFVNCFKSFLYNLETVSSIGLRLAAGSGKTVQDVNRLMKQFQDIQKLFKTVMKKLETW